MQHTSMYSELLKCNNTPYNTKKVNAFIILIKKTSSEQAKRQAKFQLYFLLSKIFLKAINNFSSLIRNVPEYKVLHTKEDIAMECYLIMDTCLDKLRMEDLKKFYFYLNSALNRGVYRIYERQYKRYFNVIDTGTEEKEHLLLNKGYLQEIDFTEIDLSSLTEEEISVLLFKKSGERLSTFLKKEKMPSAVYYSTFESAREKLFQIYQNEPYFKEYLSA